MINTFFYALCVRVLRAHMQSFIHPHIILFILGKSKKSKCVREGFTNEERVLEDEGENHAVFGFFGSTDSITQYADFG
jgi:hypothetical protein